MRAGVRGRARSLLQAANETLQLSVASDCYKCRRCWLRPDESEAAESETAESEQLGIGVGAHLPASDARNPYPDYKDACKSPEVCTAQAEMAAFCAPRETERIIEADHLPVS